ncbi:DUF3325 domain-containing protein [Cellvibrio fontiphilus]|uniref:DUF3325 domain-containing protein n=1 Tax=Cellvibrio fontiphilus TaxID=1815559 RepID=A0ABV7FHE6_9GAMM
MVEPWVALMLAALSCFVGFAWFALAMSVHWQQVMKTTSAPSLQIRATLRLLGSVGLLVAALFCFIADRPSMAILVWLMLLAVCAPSVAMLLAWRPQLLRLLWPGVKVKA